MPQSLDNLSVTWNSAGTTFTALKFSVTDTASAAGSLLMDLRAGAAGTTSLFRVTKQGDVAVQTTVRTPTNDDFGITNTASGYHLSAGSTTAPFIQVGGVGTHSIRIRSDGAFQWSNGTNASGTADVALFRDAAQTLAQRNGTNAQTFRVYNTFTDASNYERGKIEWASNVLRIGTEKAGTGTARALELQTDGTTRVTIAANGAVTVAGDFTANSVGGGAGVAVNSGGYFAFSSRGGVDSSADGVFRLRNNASSDFGRLQFGGTTSSFPSIKRNGTTLQARLADDTDFATFDGILSMEGTAPATTGATGTAGELRYDANYLYVCTAANTWKRVAIATW